MTAAESSERDAIMARLAQTRSEISRLLEPPPAAEGEAHGPRGLGEDFPAAARCAH